MNAICCLLVCICAVGCNGPTQLHNAKRTGSNLRARPGEISSAMLADLQPERASGRVATTGDGRMPLPNELSGTEPAAMMLTDLARSSAKQTYVLGATPSPLPHEHTHTD
jgi:hypothetical protein